MKKKDYCIIIVIFLCLSVGSCRSYGQVTDNYPILPTDPSSLADQSAPFDHVGSNDSEKAYNIEAITTGEFRAVWVATVLNLDFPSRQGLSAAAMRAEIDAITAHTAQLGLNAIIFQVRPAGDSFYKSDIFPWSQWLTGKQGSFEMEFDPLAYWIEACREYGLELHAWLNPYRIIHTNANSSNPEILAPDNPARLRPELSVSWTAPNGNAGLFLDPGLPEARALIIDGVAEIIEKYDVDGIHIDDYFYPGTNFNDAASFAQYGNGMDLADWRRENVNLLIIGIRDIISELNDEMGKNVRWGVSPTAIWMNGSNDPLGVPTTSGQESYHAMYADTRRWVMEEWVDYICPQIYWYIGFGIADFEAILNWWIDLCKDYNVDLYIGHAAYREDLNDQPPNWHGEMVRQLEMAEQSDIVKGSVFFRFQSIKGAVGYSIRDFYAREDETLRPRPVMQIDALMIGTPPQDTTVTAAAASSVGHRITGISDPGKPLYMNGEEINGRSIEGFFSVFVPLTQGENVFTFSQEGLDDVTRVITRNTSTPGSSTPPPTPSISAVTTPTYATVTAETAWVYPANSSAGGSDWLMFRGQMDRVTGESSNGFLRLSCGMWISRDAVTLSTRGGFLQNVLQNGVYNARADYDVIVWQSEVYAGAYAGFDGRVLTLRFGMHTQTPPLTLPDDLSETIFESVQSGMDGNTPFIAFTVRDGAKLEGYYIEYDEGEFRLHLKKRKSLTDGARPLTGITIVLDPGHGGEEYGALGPLGSDLSEKDLNLINSRKLAERLEALGATVHMTRDEDVDVSLQERVNFNLQIKPDLFISLHINSIAETTDASNVRGFTVWYRNPSSIAFSHTVLDTMHNIILGTTRNRVINQANFYVCRPQWAPSVLLEAGFIINIDDFVWLIDPVQQDKMADATVRAILEYFRP